MLTSHQLTDKVFMIRPRSFGFNAQTEKSNKFQKSFPAKDTGLIKKEALTEFDNMVQRLRDNDIEVEVFEDLEQSELPDSVFPNNWISTHEDGSVFTYPMYAAIRRAERREDVIDQLNKSYKISKRYCLEVFELQNQFLEGTGSLVLDRDYKLGYACLSPRTDARVIHKFSLLSGYNIIFFKAYDRNGHEIYHTNVLMALGLDYVICCMDAIEESKMELLRKTFQDTSKDLISISFNQMEHFAGNMLEVKNKSGQRILILSESAYATLTLEQKAFLEKRSRLLPVNITTIETIGGGSARCMIAENFLPRL